MLGIRMVCKTSSCWCTASWQAAGGCTSFLMLLRCILIVQPRYVASGVCVWWDTGGNYAAVACAAVHGKGCGYTQVRKNSSGGGRAAFVTVNYVDLLVGLVVCMTSFCFQWVLGSTDHTFHSFNFVLGMQRCHARCTGSFSVSASRLGLEL
jgi:hypothetical protein